jgi:hypothetical protein
MLTALLAAINPSLPLPSEADDGLRNTSTPPDSPPPQPLALCATPGCGAFPPPGHYRWTAQPV